MSIRVYVAGKGVITAIGNNVQENLHSLQTGNAGMDRMVHLDSAHRDQFPVAEVKLSNDELTRLTNSTPGLPRTALLGLMAADEAMHSLFDFDLKSIRKGFISANTVGGMDLTENFFAHYLKNVKSGQLRDVVNHECGAVSDIVAEKLGLTDYIATISTACSSSANAIFFGARLIRHNILDIVVAGGADALTKFTLNGFGTLMILDHEHCTPFDENRRGLNLGEGAGYVLLISEKVAKMLERKPGVHLSGYANANDAYHQTASSPDGTGSYLAMTQALVSANLETNDIDYINLHGTGTQNNDIAEGTAIKRLFSPRFPKMSSTKSFTGHTLGASGGVEAVYSILAIENGLIFPNLRLKTPMKDLPFIPETIFSSGNNIRHVMSNSFGFGGNCSSLIFSAV